MWVKLKKLTHGFYNGNVKYQQPIQQFTPRLKYDELVRKIGGKRIGVERVLKHAFKRNKRVFGRGLVGDWLDRRLTRRRINSSVKKQIDNFDSHRFV